MTDRDALLAGIVANPDDTLRRLVYADWLDENGEPERAEFIRVQCDLGALESAQGKPGFWSALRMRHIGCHGCSDWCRLRKRESELLVESGPRWYKEFGRAITGGTECATWSVEGPQPSGWMVFGGRWAVQKMPFVRGFVGHVTGTLAWWMGNPGVTCLACSGEGCAQHGHGDRRNRCDGSGRRRWAVGHGPQVVRTQPVERVTATDREPYLSGDGEVGFGLDGVWVIEDGSGEDGRLPADLWNLIEGGVLVRPTWKAFGTDVECDTALSAALIRWAKARPA